MGLRKNTAETPATTTTPSAAPAETADQGATKSRVRKPNLFPEAPPAAEAAALTPEATPAEAELVDDGQAAAASSAAPPEAPAPAARPADKPASAPAVRPTGGAVAVGGALGLSSPYDSLENNIPPGELGFGTFPRLKASNGMIMDSDKVQLGKWIQFEPVSWNYLWMMAPGDTDEDAKEFLTFSYDGVMAKDGSCSLEDALAAAQKAGYKKAGIKKYIEMYGYLLSAEKLPEDSTKLNKIVMISLSPESVKLWTGFKVESAMGVKLRRCTPEDLRVVTATVKVQTYGENTFSCFEFSL